MNVKFAILSTIAIIAASSTVQAAYAGDRPGARFTFAPTIYKLEQANVPPGFGQAAPNPHSVGHGSMVKGPGALGLSPTMLAARPPVSRGPRVAPIAQTQLSGVPSFTSVVPFLNPIAPQAYKGQFGQPLNSSPVVASLPPQAIKPQVAQSKPTAPVTANSNLSGRINPRRSSNNVSGRLAKPARALAARQGSPIQTYGNNNFYQPGSTAPTGSGFSTQTSVSGVLYKSTAKH